MKLYFATGNKHKFAEAQAILKKYNITLEQLDDKGAEDKESTIQEVAKSAAKHLADKHKKPMIVDDTGIFFAAYKNFPGAHPKLMFETLGYKGLLKLLEGENRAAQFVCCVAFCLPGKNPIVFEGILNGTIAEKPFGLSKDVLPYERIFIANGKPMVSLSRDEKNELSHRAMGFRKLGEWISKHD